MAFRFTRTNSSPNVGYDPKPILGRTAKKKTPILGRNDSHRKKVKSLLAQIDDLSRVPKSSKKDAEMKRLKGKLRDLRSIIV